MPETGLIFPSHEASLNLVHNDHKSVRKTAVEWIGANGWFDWVSPEQRQKAIDADSIWTLQWYPEVSAGCSALAAADLDVLLAAARSD